MLQLHKPKKKDLKDVNVVDRGANAALHKSCFFIHRSCIFTLHVRVSLISSFSVLMLKSEEKLLSEANCGLIQSLSIPLRHFHFSRSLSLFFPAPMS